MPLRSNKPKRTDTLKHFSKTFQIPYSRVTAINRLCKAHGITIQQLPAWLLKKDPNRVKSWLKTGK